jgi:hypothetical protein
VRWITNASGSRWAQAAAIAILTGLAVLALLQVRGGWWFQDTEAYWQAAMRIRFGEPLYAPLSSEDASSVYRYAPWFAYGWAPLTFLPKALVFLAWTLALAVAAGYCAWVPLRHRSVTGLALALLAVALLVPAAASGNVQPAMIAALIWGLERRSAPIWIAVAASLKAAPLLLVSVFIGRRQWGRAAIAVLLTSVLVAPMLLVDLANYPTEVGAATGPLPTPASIAIAIAMAAASVPLAQTRFAWVASAAALVFAIPRWSYYQPSFLLTGLTRRGVDQS